jgi:hypothetical protein
VPTWFLHTVGGADLGVAAGSDDLRAARAAAVRDLPDDALPSRLVDLDWPGPCTGTVSPLGALAPALDGDVQLLLLCTKHTSDIAHAIHDAVVRVPALYGREFDSPTVVEISDLDGSGLSERAVVAALRDHLVPGPTNRAMVTWGSGSTQLAFGAIEAATAAGVPWTLLGLTERDGTIGELAPDLTSDGFDPIVPLLHRWRCHDGLARLAELAALGLTGEQRQALRDAATARERAHTAPTAAGLRLLVSDVLAKRDITGAFTIRRYVLARYHELRDQQSPPPLDLEVWATAQWRRRTRQGAGRRPELGELLAIVRRASATGPADVRESLGQPSGRWLVSDAATALNKAGQATHRMTAIHDNHLRCIRAHLDGMPSAGPVAGLPDVTSAPATTAWHLRIAGRFPDPPHQRLLHDIADAGVDQPVADYLGLGREDVPRRFLVLGTAGVSDTVAERMAADLADAEWTRIPAEDTAAEDVAAWDDTAAEAVLRQRFRGDVGALVVMPTGPKSMLLPLLVAAHRLARENGVPLFLRHLTERDAMHQLPLRFGAQEDLLALAADALSTVEIEVAARLLDACADERDLARAVRDLAAAVFCRGGAPAGVDPRTWTLGLTADRLAVWARLATERSDASHTTRAIFGSFAGVECGVRAAPSLGADPRTRWQAFSAALRGDGHVAARLLAVLRAVRNQLPTSHGDSHHDIDELVRTTMTDLGLPAAPGFSAAELLGLLAVRARTWPAVAAPALWPQARLADQFVALRDDIDRRVEAERDRRRHQALTAGQKILARADPNAGHAPDFGSF